MIQEAGQAAGIPPVVEMRNISKLYRDTGRWANRGVNLDLRRGEILCLAGENGAGKSTLMKILYGMVEPTEGEIFVRGRPEKIRSPLDANRLGIGMVHQHFMLFPEFTVAQNVVMGIEPRKALLFYSFAKAEEKVNAVIKAHRFSVDAGAQVASLAVGQMQQVEILKLLYRNADILIFDEPTAVLTDQEIASIFSTVKLLAGSGKSIILITHKPGEIKRISDRTLIMRNGEAAAVLETKDVGERELSRLLMGERARPAAEAAPQEKAARDERQKAEKTPVLSFEKVTVLRRGQKRPALNSVSFTVCSGEVLGFAGVGGNGLGTLEAVLGGFLPVSRGRILLRGKDISALKTRSLRKLDLAYVPGDRLSVGTAPGASVAENMMVNRRRGFFPRGLLDGKALSRFTGDLIDRYGIAGKAEQPLRSLSGGNIQKLILAREIDRYRDYIVFSEPTWGLDVSSSRYVYDQIGLLRGRGAAVILISSNMDEILFNADRVLVFCRGAVAAEIANPLAGMEGADEKQSQLSCLSQLSRLKEEIGSYMLGLDGGLP
ncbi:MAG: ABC transporter ATP-binding protein [Treponema sp.]|jgi:simple sugar transport system ATP-binding protein|nr:ABC transporter ATP-binding protein [Treponema sp.]